MTFSFFLRPSLYWDMSVLGDKFCIHEYISQRPQLEQNIVFKKGATHSSVANPAGYTLYTLPYDKAGATYTISLIVNSTFTIIINYK